MIGSELIFLGHAVLTELDEMKKSREDARNAIRWLETEFSKGSRFLRLQRSYETQAIPLLKTPRKFGKLMAFRLESYFAITIRRPTRRSRSVQLSAGGPVLQLHAGQPRRSIWRPAKTRRAHTADWSPSG